MIDLAMLSRRLRITGRRMRVCNAQPQVWRLIQVVGLHRLPGVVAEPHAPAYA